MPKHSSLPSCSCFRLFFSLLLYPHLFLFYHFRSLTDFLQVFQHFCVPTRRYSTVCIYDMWPMHIYWMGWTKRGSQPSPHKAANPFCALYPYLAFSCADIVEGHGTLTGSNGDAMAAVTVTNHIEPVQNRQKCPSFAETIEYLQDRRLRL